MVKSMPIDEYSGLADKKDYACKIEDLELEDTTQLTEEQLLDQALLAEDAMLKNKKITKVFFDIPNFLTLISPPGFCNID